MVWYWVCGSETSEMRWWAVERHTRCLNILCTSSCYFSIPLFNCFYIYIYVNIYIYIYMYIQNKETLAAINLPSLGMVNIPSIELVILGWCQWSSEDKQLHAVTNFQQSCNFLISDWFCYIHIYIYIYYILYIYILYIYMSCIHDSQGWIFAVRNWRGNARRGSGVSNCLI